MTAIILCLENKVKKFFGKNNKCILGGLLVGLLVYFMMMSQNLVNDLDGIWHLSNFIAGDWEISLGRGLQRYADRARFGIVSDSFNTILTLLLITIANAMIIGKFELVNIVYQSLVMVILICNPVICNSLSYSYMSVNFGLAYFFSVFSFSLMENQESARNNIISILVSSVCLGISLAFYQAYIGVTCVLIVFYVIKMLVNKENTKRVITHLLLCGVAVVSGGIFYLLITKALLYRADIQMATYKGASGVSLQAIVVNLPFSIKQCYSEFLKYFFSYKVLSDLEFIEICLCGIAVVCSVSVIMRFMELIRRNVVNAFLFLGMVLLLPLAACFVLIIAVGNTMSVLMSMGIAMCIVMMIIIVPKDGKASFGVQRLSIVLLSVFAWFQISAVVNDQLALKEGKTATITLTQNIVSQLYEEKYLDVHSTVAFVGRPANNDRFAQSTAYHMANEYAKFGCWSTDARNNKVSWEGVLSNFVGVNLNVCGEEEYKQLISLEEVALMPEFPAEGSIGVIDDVVVVKVSELY